MLHVLSRFPGCLTGMTAVICLLDALQVLSLSFASVLVGDTCQPVDGGVTGLRSHAAEAGYLRSVQPCRLQRTSPCPRLLNFSCSALGCVVFLPSTPVSVARESTNVEISLL